MAEYAEEGIKRYSTLGVLPFAFVSSILLNVYLDEFDLFIEKLISIHHSTAKDKPKTRNTGKSH